MAATTCRCSAANSEIHVVIGLNIVGGLLKRCLPSVLSFGALCLVWAVVFSMALR